MRPRDISILSDKYVWTVRNLFIIGPLLVKITSSETGWRELVLFIVSNT